MPDIAALLLFCLQLLLLLSGCLFFAVGTLGLFRFSDTLTRIHALTKVDNLGLGCIVLGLLPLLSVAAGLKTLLIWLVALAASATSAHLVARAVDVGRALREEDDER
ncbi:cation:proton antiporter [Kineobactrum salinum]|uniref:Monovalent cation/H(+) antiporter subunit G n=1 Tax=Kineobactrum salinum TaxID=2708301 RepID=A0A6C0TZ34_9GAMM|nr:monovalent cation/H(+) antiporter subunit G [Kineobactrum salinum]QIB65036.1 monovalent cation/H(+) antiporter subunit G [Kineobactrum salinum]